MVATLKWEALWVELREIILITAGLALYACAWNMFILPQGFVGGGLGGLCAMFYYATGVPISVSYLVANIGLCGVAFFFLGQDFSVKTIYGILGVVFFLAVIPVPEVPMLNDKLLSGIMAGIISGIGIGTYLLQGASTGGADIIVVIISKYKNVSWGRVYLAFDACVIASSIFLPNRTLETVAYGYVFMGVSAYVIDLVHSGMKQSVQMMIFTTKSDEIATEITKVHRRGVTLFESIGFYTQKQRRTVFLVARKRETQEIFRSVKKIDAQAFIVVSNAMSVFGTGFDTIKTGFSKEARMAARQHDAKLANGSELCTFTLTSAAEEVAADPEILCDESEAASLDQASGYAFISPISSSVSRVLEEHALEDDQLVSSHENYDERSSLSVSMVENQDD